MDDFIRRWELAWETGIFLPRPPWEEDVFCRHEPREQRVSGPRAGWLRGGSPRQSMPRVPTGALGLPVSTSLPLSPPPSPRAGGRDGAAAPLFNDRLPISLAWAPVDQRRSGLCWTALGLCWPRRSTAGPTAALGAAAARMAPSHAAAPAVVVIPEVWVAARLEPAPPAAAEAPPPAMVEPERTLLLLQATGAALQEEGEAQPGGDAAAAAVGGEPADRSASAAETSGPEDTAEEASPADVSSPPTASDDGSDGTWLPRGSQPSSGVSTSLDDGSSRAGSLSGAASTDGQSLELSPSPGGLDPAAGINDTLPFATALLAEPAPSATASRPLAAPIGGRAAPSALLQLLARDGAPADDVATLPMLLPTETGAGQTPLSQHAPAASMPPPEPQPSPPRAGRNPRRRSSRGKLGRGSGKTKQAAQAAAAAAAVAAALSGLRP